jgi:hypothetical protein
MFARLIMLCSTEYAVLMVFCYLLHVVAMLKTSATQIHHKLQRGSGNTQSFCRYNDGLQAGGARNFGSIPDRDNTTLHRIRSDAEAYPASYSVCIWALLTGQIIWSVKPTAHLPIESRSRMTEVYIHTQHNSGYQGFYFL